ncbi:MAG: hypothetical protein HC908_03225 [Calothrix sp. SM1_7_51]|nr:hypothetical protein [Calothrix sp. SM1_7_51]
MLYQPSSKNQLASINQIGMKSFVFHVDDLLPNFNGVLIDEVALALKKVKVEIENDRENKHKFMAVASKLVALLRNQHARNEKFICQFSLEFIGIEIWSEAQTQTIKFCQRYKDVVVYGSSVTVDVDDNYELIAINSVIVTSIRLNSNFKMRLEKLKQIVKSRSHNFIDNDFKPVLYYYFDSHINIWRLVYYVENKVKDTVLKLEEISQMVDYIFDARTGELLVELPRTKTTK